MHSLRICVSYLGEVGYHRAVCRQDDISLSELFRSFGSGRTVVDQDFESALSSLGFDLHFPSGGQYECRRHTH